MSWLGRKQTPDTNVAGDPTIDYARRVIQNPARTRNGREADKDRRDRVTAPPSGSDADFCYGEEINPCA